MATETEGPAAHTHTQQKEKSVTKSDQITTLDVYCVFCFLYLGLDAAQVHKVEVTGQSGLQRSKGLQRWDASPFGQDGQCQYLVVQDGVGHVTEYRGEASCPNVHHL